MPTAWEIEDIEGLRRRAGIDEAELREAIRVLRAGDLVRLTLRTGTEAFAGETVPVRITSVRGRAFRGRLVHRPASAALPELRVGTVVNFTAAHVHSVPKERPTHGH
jgi:hypothetical protein